MNMAIASLIALALAIVLGFVRKLNVGIVAIALAYIIGIAYGLSAKDITGGFSSSMAMTMIGVMYLFAIVSKNGTLELLAKKITGLARGNRYLLYVAIYVIGIILSGVGPGHSGGFEGRYESDPAFTDWTDGRPVRADEPHYPGGSGGEGFDGGTGAGRQYPSRYVELVGHRNRDDYRGIYLL